MERGVVIVAGTLVLAAAVVMIVGVSPSEEAPPVDYPVEQPAHAAPPLRPLRAGPERPLDPPEGAVQTSESGLAHWDVEVGTGEQSSEGQVVQIEYTAWLENEMAVESTAARRDPARFVVGSGTVQPALDEGVRGMRVGGARQLVAPPELAYGDEGVLNRVPPHSTLTYHVRLTGLWDLPTDPPHAQTWATMGPGLRVADLREGDGDPLGPAQVAFIDYAMWANRELVDSTFDRPRPMRVQLGAGRLFDAWEQGMTGMKAGGRRLLEIDAEHAYGAAGRGQVPPDATLQIEVVLRRAQ